ncbi:MAG: molecular chaperone HtpG [Ruminococcaceae bacterium]|nr:molecular chaperone HtpG [Oscillospiraceae bacterium]
MSEKIKGGISVDRENIFPIIKKWLYSEKDIFLREIVSNATDAITKLKRLQSLGEAKSEQGDFRIDVRLDRVAKTLSVEDNGIGMTGDELKKYICSIALSGAVDFINKYESTEDSAKGGIIGHFGLGFYSAFMVSERVEIETRSHTGAPAVHWVCSADGDYEIEAGERESIGTEVILHIDEDEAEYLNAARIRAMLDKYCAFMPVPIYFDDSEEKKEASAEAPINDVSPLWQRPASECTDDDYKAFYTKVFGDHREPLFQIHINADYPLNFRGILYFPRITNQYESIEGQVKLYYNQVFVADNIKEVIPDYLLMLKGVLDCPELPLNVSRSYLQTNSYVAKVSAHIVKKVADKLISLSKNERERYEAVWNDIKTFVEYAAIRDKKFRDRIKDHLLLHLTDGSYKTIDEYLENAKQTNENTIYYTTDKAAQAQYVALFEARGIAVCEFDSLLDTQFATAEEMAREGVKFLRVDADLGALTGEESEADKPLADLFCEVSGNEKLNVKQHALTDSDVPVIISVSEESRRMDDMMKMYRMTNGEEGAFSLPLDTTLILNSNAPLLGRLSALLNEDRARAKALAAHLYRLALLSHRKLNADEMSSFLSDSYRLLAELL